MPVDRRESLGTPGEDTLPAILVIVALVAVLVVAIIYGNHLLGELRSTFEDRYWVETTVKFSDRSW